MYRGKQQNHGWYANASLCSCQFVLCCSGRSLFIVIYCHRSALIFVLTHVTALVASLPSFYLCCSHHPLSHTIPSPPESLNQFIPRASRMSCCPADVDKASSFRHTFPPALSFILSKEAWIDMVAGKPSGKLDLFGHIILMCFSA